MCVGCKSEHHSLVQCREQRGYESLAATSPGPAISVVSRTGRRSGSAEILFGKVTPSGKLPLSFEKRWAGNPVYDYYYDHDGDKRVSYGEAFC
ncbi:hypothetical protein EEL34_09200 [Muribaculaceae bacterium Isolate-039 (Harlan)]|nr:hypothetical protein EEL34_09200 [Muribaculaceae bacterium Isolate-039 (Harlan)]